ncbi:MAG: GldG family protein, partial [Oscillospiraceae bacterium]
ALSIVFIGIIVLVNILANIVSERYAFTIDLTKGGVFSISEQTKAFVSNLQKEVTITVLTDEQEFETGNEYFRQAKTIIDLYQKQSEKIKISYIDLVKNPSFAIDFAEQDAQANDIIIQSGEKSRIISIFDLFNLQQTQNGVIPISSKAENEITSAIMGVTSDNNPKIALLGSPSTVNTSYFKNLLVKNNFDVTDIDLLVEEIPQNAQIAILIAPERDFSQEMIAKLDVFLKDTQTQSKNLFYFADFRQPPTPLLDEFLAEWGIRVEQNPVFETDIKKVINQNMYFPMLEYTMPDYAIETMAKRLVSVAPYGRAITLLYDEQGYKNWKPSNKDIIGPIPAIVRSQRYDEQVDKNTAAIFVSSSAMLLDSNLLASSVVGNADYIMEILNITTNSTDHMITILPKELGGSQLGITFGGVIGYGILFVVTIPLIILIMGILIWLNRRRK